MQIFPRLQPGSMFRVLGGLAHFPMILERFPAISERFPVFLAQLGQWIHAHARESVCVIR